MACSSSRPTRPAAAGLPLAENLAGTRDRERDSVWHESWAHRRRPRGIQTGMSSRSRMEGQKVHSHSILAQCAMLFHSECGAKQGHAPKPWPCLAFPRASPGLRTVHALVFGTQGSRRAAAASIESCAASHHRCMDARECIHTAQAQAIFAWFVHIHGP